MESFSSVRSLTRLEEQIKALQGRLTDPNDELSPEAEKAVIDTIKELSKQIHKHPGQKT